MKSYLNILFLAAFCIAFISTGCLNKHSERGHKNAVSNIGHDREVGEHGSEGEESGTDFGLTETYDEIRNGAHLILSYDGASNSFVGSVENTTKNILERVRVEVHLSNGVELGSTSPGDLEPGAKKEVKLVATQDDFERWTAHPEVGNKEHSHEGDGEHDEGGEHNEGREHGVDKKGEHT